MPFFIVDTNLTITYMNDHLEKLTGYRSSEVVNRMSCAEVLRSSYCHTDDCLLKQAMEKQDAYRRIAAHQFMTAREEKSLWRYTVP